MKLTFNQTLNFKGGMLPSKHEVNTCAMIKIEGCHFTCKTTSKRLNVRERVKMAETNKDGSFPSTAIRWIASFS